MRPTPLVSARMPSLSIPIWISGFTLPQWRGLPEQEAGDWGQRTERGRDQGTLPGTPHPAPPCPEPAVPCGHCLDSTKTSKGWGPCTGMWGPAPLWPPPAPPGHLGRDHTSSDAPPVLDSPTGIASLPEDCASEGGEECASEAQGKGSCSFQNSLKDKCGTEALRAALLRCHHLKKPKAFPQDEELMSPGGTGRG